MNINKYAPVECLSENMCSTSVTKNSSRSNLYAEMHLSQRNSWNGTEFVQDMVKTKLQSGYFAYLIHEKTHGHEHAALPPEATAPCRNTGPSATPLAV